MNTKRPRESRHGLLKLAALALPMLALLGCDIRFERARPRPRHRPDPHARHHQLPAGLHQAAGAHRTAMRREIPRQHAADIDARDLITSITGSDLYIRNTASAAGAEVNVTGVHHRGQRRRARPRRLARRLESGVFAATAARPEHGKTPTPSSPIGRFTSTTPSAQDGDAADQSTTSPAGHDVGAHYLPDGQDRVRLHAPARNAIDTAR